METYAHQSKANSKDGGALTFSSIHSKYMLIPKHSKCIENWVWPLEYTIRLLCFSSWECLRVSRFPHAYYCAPSDVLTYTMVAPSSRKKKIMGSMETPFTLTCPWKHHSHLHVHGNTIHTKVHGYSTYMTKGILSTHTVPWEHYLHLQVHGSTAYTYIMVTSTHTYIMGHHFYAYEHGKTIHPHMQCHGYLFHTYIYMATYHIYMSMVAVAPSIHTYLSMITR